MVVMDAFWMWLIVGLVLLLLELIVNGFVICFFGVGALIIGLLDFFFDSVSIAWWLFLWAVLSLALFFLCRKLFPTIFKGNSKNNETMHEIETDSVAGAPAVVTEQIYAKTAGKVDFRGSVWMAKTNSGKDIPVGAKVVIIKRENITLIVEEL